jgi:APA family basic amino acid/polyamine antiporter
MANWWFSLTGPSLALAFLVTMLLMIPVAFCYSELVSMMPYAGGSYNFIAHAFNPMISFIFMWSQTISYYAVTTFNILATIWILQYMGVVPGTQEALIVAGLGFAVFYAVLNWFKVELSATVQFFLFWLLFITGMIWNGLDLFMKPTFSTAYFADLFPFGMGGFMIAAGSMVTMYFGFEVVAHMSEEANFPSKKLPIPVIGSIVTAATVYVVTLTALAGSAPLDWLVGTANMPAEIIYLTNGFTTWAQIGWWGIVLGGIACALTCVDGFWLALSRLFYSLGQANLFPKFFERLNRCSVPGLANIVVFLGLVPMIVFSGSSWISTLFIIMGITIAIVYVGATLSFIQLRRKHPEWKRSFRAPGGIAMGVLGLVGSGFCVAATAYALTPIAAGGGNYSEALGGWDGWVITIGYLIVGVIVYFLMQSYRKSRNLETKMCPAPECEFEPKHTSEPRKS